MSRVWNRADAVLAVRGAHSTRRRHPSSAPAATKLGESPASKVGASRPATTRSPNHLWFSAKGPTYPALHPFLANRCLLSRREAPPLPQAQPHRATPAQRNDAQRFSPFSRELSNTKSFAMRASQAIPLTGDHLKRQMAIVMPILLGSILRRAVARSLPQGVPRENERSFDQR